jgi:hypothetical protein
LAAQLEHEAAPSAAENLPGGQREQAPPISAEPAAHVHESEAPEPAVVKPAAHTHEALLGSEEA